MSNTAKTLPTTASVEEYIAAIPDPQVRADCQALCKLMHELTKANPIMWGTSIIGFDTYTYKYASGRTGEWPRIGFSPRKTNLTIYAACYLDRSEVAPLLEKLGKHSAGKACIYVKRLSDISLPALKKVLQVSLKHTMGEVIA